MVAGIALPSSGGAKWQPAMAHLIDRDLVERANTALLLGILWGALATCVLGALAYDIAYWLDGW
jgi:hypothetical protein